MNKLYEVLAVEQDRKQKSNIELGRLRKTFEKQAEMFDGLTKRYVPLEEITIARTGSSNPPETTRNEPC